MKFLTLIRHAKSDWDNDLNDFDRPLSARGLRDAPIMGQFLNTNVPKPDLIISSSAERAKQTAIIISEEIKYPPQKIDYYSDLYLCGISDYIEVIHQQEDEVKHIFLFSHNPGTTGFSNILCNTNIFNVPTCGVVHIELDIASWRELELGKGKLLEYLTPKSIR